MGEFFTILAVGFTLTMILGIIFCFVAFMRYLRHQERKILAENGLGEEKVNHYE